MIDTVQLRRAQNKPLRHSLEPKKDKSSQSNSQSNNAVSLKPVDGKQGAMLGRLFNVTLACQIVPTQGMGRMQTVSLEQAVAMIPDGASLMIGGFMAIGTPERVVDEIVRQNKRNLTVIANDTASPGRGIGKLIAAKLVHKAIVSHIGLNPETQRQMTAGELEVELVPQGTLIERIRAGGYGLGGVLTQTGIGTTVEEGKQQVKVDGKRYLLEVALRADFALVHAFLVDYLGNLSYALTARNFNPVVAMAADTVIVDADNIVPIGVISPDHIVTPAPVVDYLVMNA
jgi:acetate CoA/acetoacetate CoA-transferase alpha subunit